MSTTACEQDGTITSDGIAVAIDLPVTSLSALDTAIPDAIDLIHDTRLGLLMIAEAITMHGVDADQPGLGALMRLMGRALELAETKEAPALEQLDGTLRHATSKRIKEGIVAELTEGR